MPLGIYISVPFCRTKCSYCNFASGVFSRALWERYVDRVCVDIENATQLALEMGGHMERAVDSIYLGGGTPTVLDGLSAFTFPSRSAAPSAVTAILPPAYFRGPCGSATWIAFASTLKTRS